MVWTRSLNPVRSFPTYNGPYHVGSLDLEIPTTELESTHSGPDPDIATVAFRVFYPCATGEKKKRPVRWLCDPQRTSFSAYARFLGAGPALADTISYLTPHLYYIAIPVQRNAAMLKPETPSGRWPVVVFSHGLGGCRNTYSHLLGSLASHGMVVFATEHRDASAPISFIRATKNTGPRTIRYCRHPHEPSPAVYAARDEQLKVRLWELSLVYSALLKIDSGETVTPLGCREASSTPKALSGLAHALDVHRAGSITWAGHSFGAATTVQFVKSVYWRCPNPATEAYVPLYVPSLESPLTKQVTSQSPVVVLDLWTMPLVSPLTTWLRNKPMPSYDKTSPLAAGGSVLLAVLSEAFFKWAANLNETRRVLSPQASESGPIEKELPKPRFFYPHNSAHLSQSDFGILFPWLTRRVFGALEPERVVRLNTRAILQMFRENNIDVAETKRIDAEEEQELKQASESDMGIDSQAGEGHMGERKGDWKILAADGRIRGWVSIGVEEDKEVASDQVGDSIVDHEATDDSSQRPTMEGEMLTELTKGGPALS